MNNIKKISIIISIRAKLETSHHSGYCSDNENKYNCDIKNYLVDLPETLIEKINNINEFTDEDLNKFSYKWESLLPIPNVRGDSYYCRNSQKSKENGLSSHDYRYTILSIEIHKIL